MKRKFYGVLMLGALAVASASLTSCKDYDDDINNLQTQVNSLSQTVDQKETAIKQLIADLDAAYKKADADLQTAYQQADKDLESGYKAGDVATLAAAKTAIEEAKKALESTISANYESLDAKNKEQDIAIAKAQADASNALNLLASKANQSELDALKADVQKITNELNSTKAELSQISTGLQQAFGDLANLGTALKAQQAALEAVQNLANQNQKDIAANKDAIDALIKRVDAAEIGLKNANDAIAEANKTIEEVRVAAEARAAKIDSKYETITAMISKDLRSLVYMPKLYMDGIETIEYPWLYDTTMVAINSINAFNRSESDHASPMTTQTIEIISTPADYRKATTFTESTWLQYGPVWDVEYHMNPSIANVNYGQVVGFYAYNVETITRGAWGNPGDNPYNTYPKNEASSTWGGITSPEKYDNWLGEDDKVFNVANGIVTAGLQIKKPYQMVDQKDGVKNVIVALQVKSRLNNVDTVITSDYAMLYPERIELDGIVWNKYPAYWDANDAASKRIRDYWEITKGYGAGSWINRTQGRDQACPWNAANIIHVWDNPKDALTHPADIMLQVGKVEDLSQYLGVHFYYNAQVPGDSNYPFTAQMQKYQRKSSTWAFNADELKRLGLAWQFDSVEYRVAQADTRDSKYIVFNDHKFGKIHSANVDANGNTIDEANHTSVGREPLIRVKLYHYVTDPNANKPLYDGYIRVHIYKPEVKDIIWPKTFEYKFDLCNALSRSTTWAEFNKWILTDQLQINGEGMEKSQFDALFTADLTGVSQNVRNKSDQTPLQRYEMKQYNVTHNADGEPVLTEKKLGTFWFQPDNIGTTNDIFDWEFTEEELEALTHDKTLPYTESTWIHFTGRNVGPWDDVYIQFTATFTRDDVKLAKLNNKNEVVNYWTYESYENINDIVTYRDGFEATRHNTIEPNKGGSTYPWTFTFNNWFKVSGGANRPTFDGFSGNNWKYYITPIETEITDQEGTTWVLTPRRGKDDKIYDKFICKYWGEKHQYALKPNNNTRSNGSNSVHVDEEKNNATLNACAINYNNDPTELQPEVDGVFANDTLFAVKKSEYTSKQEYEPIAIMDQKTGVIRLLKYYEQNRWLAADVQPSGSKWSLTVASQKENEITELILNAFGYDESKFGTGQNPIHKQLRAWIGTITMQSCGIAMRMSDAPANKVKDNEFASWMAAWERPINVFTEDTIARDARTSFNYIYIVDILNMYDWRGYALKSPAASVADKTFSATDVSNYRGGMFGKQMWFWAYYNVQSIKVDLANAYVKHRESTNWTKLATNTLNLEFWAGHNQGIINTASNNQVRYTANMTPYQVNFNLLGYNDAEMNDQLIADLGLEDERDANGENKKKGQLGYILYFNNHGNVDNFDLRVPVSVKYEWGWFTTEITIHVGATGGNAEPGI